MKGDGGHQVTDMQSAYLPLPLLLLFIAGACGGAVAPDSGEQKPQTTPAVPSAPSQPLHPPSSATPGNETSGDGGAGEGGTAPLPQGILAVVPSFPECRSIVGANAKDLWCVRTTDVVHWDGTSWGTPIAVPLPAGNDTASAAVAFSSSPSFLLVGSTYGLAKIDPDGKTEDVTPAGFDKPNAVALGYEPSDSITPVRLAYRGNVYYWIGDKDWVHLPVVAPGDIRGILPGYYLGGDFVEKSGGAIARGGLDSYTLNLVTVAGTLWTARQSNSGIDDISARYCPDWCHEGYAPLHEPLVFPWTLTRWVTDSASPENLRIDSFTVDIPADVPQDGSVEYQGHALLRTASDRLALVGCTRPKPASGSSSDWTKILVHAWAKGEPIGPARSLPADLVACPDANIMPGPLNDGTWVLRSTSDGFVLVAP